MKKYKLTYTMLKCLENEGVFVNKGGEVSALLKRNEYYAGQSKRFVEETFAGSLPKFLKMSITFCYVILFVILARLLLKRTPKIFSYLLWSVVLFRLLCPFFLESYFSIIPPALNSAETQTVAHDISYGQAL